MFVIVWAMLGLALSEMNIDRQISRLKTACYMQPVIIREIPICYDRDCHIRKITPVNLCDNPRTNYMYFELN